MNALSWAASQMGTLLSPHNAAVLVALAYWSQDAAVAITHKELQSASGVGNTKRAVRDLERLGLIESHRRWEERTGAAMPNEYRLRLDRSLTPPQTEVTT